MPKPSGLALLDLHGIAEARGGLVNAMITKAMHRLAADLEVAPDHDGARTLTLKVKFKPVMENRELRDVQIEYEVDGRTPSRLASDRGLVRRNREGQCVLCFNPDSPDNPHQLTFLGDGPQPANSEVKDLPHDAE